MKDDQKDQNSVNENQEHRAPVSTERAAEAADSQSGQPMKIERLVLSIATNQFTVPLPSGMDVIRMVNAHDELVNALETNSRILHNEAGDHGPNFIDFETCWQSPCVFARNVLALAAKPATSEQKG